MSNLSIQQIRDVIYECFEDFDELVGTKLCCERSHCTADNCRDCLIQKFEEKVGTDGNY